MGKYIIRWNCGYGDEYDVVEADSELEAENLAYEAWKESAENYAEYVAEDYTEERAEELGLE